MQSHPYNSKIRTLCGKFLSARNHCQFDTLISLSGCTIYRVQPISTNEEIDKAWVLHNQEVLIDGFEDLLVKRLNKSGIETEVVVDFHKIPNGAYWISYTGRKSWQIVPYLSHAEVYVHKGHQLVGKEYYRHRGGVLSLSFAKWKSADRKIERFYDKLLLNFPAKELK